MSRRASTGVVVMSYACLALVSCLLIGYIYQAGLQSLKLFTSAVEQSDRTTKNYQNRYKYVIISGEEKPILAPDAYLFEPGEMLVLVNKSHTLPAEFAPKHLVAAPLPVHQNDAAIMVADTLVTPLKNLFEAAKKEGITLFIRSAYRTATDQKAIYAESAAGYAALPGQSEHQTGLAIDFNSGNQMCGQNCVLDVTAQSWLEKHAAEYGFIQRYESGKEQETGYPAESWHYRYVGERLAKLMVRNNISYEVLYDAFAQARARQ